MAGQFICEKEWPVVQTKAGKLRGFVVDGTYTFHGIKYADADRFHLPREVEPWEGIKDALAYGYVCPVPHQNDPTNANELLMQHRYWPMNEHCQYLNVWTQSLDENAKKPVMVWIHGGGFTAGSSIELVGYEGDNMSKYGDCVAVSINHRLNILGYLDLSQYGEEYKNSANAGTADMVAALQWIHDNIAQFGGDPENVTIFGQSGGGMKVTCLLQTPAADGLFHRGIVMSGVAADGPLSKTSNGGGKPIVEAMLKVLGLAEGDVKSLEKVPFDRMMDAYTEVLGDIRAQGYYVGCAPMPDDYYLGDALEIGFREHAKTVPVMVGSVICEISMGAGLDKDALSEAEKTAIIFERFGERSGELIELYKKTYPKRDLIDLLSMDNLFRRESKRYVAAKGKAGGAPTYSYVFAFEFPIDGGKPAWHGSEIPFAMHNTCRAPVCWVPGVSDRLEDQVFTAWMNFARYGDPNHPGLPKWDASTGDHVYTMMFDRECEVLDNFDNEFFELYNELAPKFIVEEVRAKKK